MQLSIIDASFVISSILGKNVQLNFLDFRHNCPKKLKFEDKG